ncbi:MAG: Rid family detoxifying hydrolase [Flavobacteriales bacterium]|nr:Rid family detoxifying hydrolase [Flavobacteriales bacterium]MCX7767783.1 Rid family detoxifying hydrolase [Flavobacteriales bacterium]MDW8410628.1 Rid family detoxifying hydrolase [Flavobacteriales bacterium]
MSQKLAINISGSPPPIGPYSPAIRFGNLLFLSGVIALNPQSGALDQQSLEAEITRIMENIRHILEHAGLSFQDVLKTTIYLTHMQYFETVNKIYGSYFTPPYPARETVQVSALPRGARIEISLVAGYP